MRLGKASGRENTHDLSQALQALPEKSCPAPCTITDPSKPCICGTTVGRKESGLGHTNTNTVHFTSGLRAVFILNLDMQIFFSVIAWYHKSILFQGRLLFSWVTSMSEECTSSNIGKHGYHMQIWIAGMAHYRSNFPSNSASRPLLSGQRNSEKRLSPLF